MKRTTKGRSDDLCKGGTQSARLVCGPVRLHSQIDVVGAGDMTEFMNHSTLLRHHHQQQQGQGFERLSHQIGINHYPNRISLRYQNMWQIAAMVPNLGNCPSFESPSLCADPRPIIGRPLAQIRGRARPPRSPREPTQSMFLPAIEVSRDRPLRRGFEVCRPATSHTIGVVSFWSIRKARIESVTTRRKPMRRQVCLSQRLSPGQSTLLRLLRPAGYGALFQARQSNESCPSE
jgi:hypothetical protein